MSKIVYVKFTQQKIQVTHYSFQNSDFLLFFLSFFYSEHNKNNITLGPINLGLILVDLIFEIDL